MYPVHNNSIINEGKRTISSYADLIHYVEDRPGHDKRYAIDPGKIEQQLGWHAEVPFDEGLAKTVQWYVAKYV
jgi:dTDP-glucose 4,6-dehydratase